MTQLSDTALNKGALKRLAAMGIYTVQQLSKFGAVNAYSQMRKQFPKASLPKCYNYYDPAAILKGKSGWKSLTVKEKSELDALLTT